MTQRNLLTAVMSVAAFSALNAHAQDDAVRPTTQPLSRPDLVRQAPVDIARPELQIRDVEIKPGNQVTALQIEWARPAQTAVVNRAGAALSIMSGGRYEAKHVKAAISEGFSLEAAENGAWTRLPDAKHIMVKYDRPYNELRIINEEYDFIDAPREDIGPDKAVEKAKNYLKALGEAGVVDERLYENAALQLGYKRIGSGSRDGKVKNSAVAEYRFTFRPRVQNIEVANAGVRLGVFPSGELVSLRVGGVTVKAGGKGGGRTLKGRVREIKTGPNEILARFYEATSSNAKPQIAWSRLMYAMPDGKRSAIVEPLYLVSYTQHRSIDGQLVASRRKMLGYSLTDPEAAPIDFDPPAQESVDQKTTRPERTQQ